MAIEISYSGFFVWAVNGILWWLLQKKTKNIGKVLAPAIAGWISFMVGLLILKIKDLEFLSFLTAIWVLYISVVVLLILTFIYAYASKLRNRNKKTFFGKLGYYLTRAGWGIGFLIGLVIAILK